MILNTEPAFIFHHLTLKRYLTLKKLKSKTCLWSVRYIQKQISNKKILWNNEVYNCHSDIALRNRYEFYQTTNSMSLRLVTSSRRYTGIFLYLANIRRCLLVAKKNFCRKNRLRRRASSSSDLGELNYKTCLWLSNLLHVASLRLCFINCIFSHKNWLIFYA